MTDSTVDVLCYWNGTILRTETDLRYIGKDVEVVPIDVPVQTTFMQLLNMIYDIFGVDEESQLILKCRYPAGVNKFQPLVVRNDQTVARMVAVSSKHEISPIELFIEHTPSLNLNNENDHSMQLSINDIDVDEENDEDKEDDIHDVIHTDEVVLPNDDEYCAQRESSDLMLVQQVMESESTRYVNFEVSARSNDPNVEIKVENTSPVVSSHGTQVNIFNDNVEPTIAPVSYHMPPTPQFFNMDGAINCVVSDWTPWEKPTLGNIDGELSIGQIFPSKTYLQYVVKMYSIRSHHEFNVYKSNANVLVLKCKKAPNCQWRLRAMVVKDTTMFKITKYMSPHTCVNPCINQDHSQLDSSFVSELVETLVKAQMTITVAAIQAVVVEQFGYHISYQKAMKAKRKAMARLFGDWYKSYAELPRFFLALEQSNPGCIVYTKTIPGNKPNEEICHRVFWAFSPSIKGFPHC